MNKTHAFFLGLIEFRSAFTTSFDEHGLLLGYDRGRELAHKWTLRIWDAP